MHRSTIFFYILLSFIGGVFAGSFFNIPDYLAPAVLVICIILIAVFFRNDSRVLNPKITLASFLVIFFVLGVLRLNAVVSRQHTLSEIANTSAKISGSNPRHPLKVTLYGYVNGEPDVKGDKQQFAFYAKELEVLPYNVTTEEQVLVTSRLYPNYAYGEKLKITGELMAPQNSDDFDYRSYLVKDGIFTVMNYPDISESEVPLSFFERVKVKTFGIIFKIKNKFEQSIGRSIAEPNAAFVKGILLGTTSQLPYDLKDAFKRTSTNHILAVSGYNITIVALVISWFFLRFVRRPTAFWFSLAGVAFFTIMTGAQASVVRAAIMGMVVLLANRTSRLNDPRNAITLAGVVMIFLNPQILRYDIGFQLSFGATLGLIYASPVLEKYFSKLPNIFSLRETLVMTLSAQVFVLPLLLYYFKNLSLTSLPANIIVLPTIPFAMLLGFLSGVAGLILPFLGQLIGYFAWLLTSIELGIIKLFAKPAWAALSVGFQWYEAAAVYAFFVFWLARWNLKNKKNGNTDR